MSWRSNDTHSFVACDHDGCDATTGHHPYRAGDEVDRVSACTYAADTALRVGWHVPSDAAIVDGDRCPAHRPAPLHCNSCGDEAHDAADALARAWVNIVGPLWICPPCDVAPRCRVCDGITRAEGVRLCDRCEHDGQGVIGGAP